MPGPVARAGGGAGGLAAGGGGAGGCSLVQLAQASASPRPSVIRVAVRDGDGIAVI
jgi:hypothetical protein